MPPSSQDSEVEVVEGSQGDVVVVNSTPEDEKALLEVATAAGEALGAASAGAGPGAPARPHSPLPRSHLELATREAAKCVALLCAALDLAAPGATVQELLCSLQEARFLASRRLALIAFTRGKLLLLESAQLSMLGGLWAAAQEMAGEGHLEPPTPFPPLAPVSPSDWEGLEEGEMEDLEEEGPGGLPRVLLHALYSLCEFQAPPPPVADARLDAAQCVILVQWFLQQVQELQAGNAALLRVVSMHRAGIYALSMEMEGLMELAEGTQLAEGGGLGEEGEGSQQAVGQGGVGEQGAGQFEGSKDAEGGGEEDG